MPLHRVTASREIDATPETIYQVLADYRNGHPHILPPRFFGPLTIERGGVGSGTIVSFTVRVFGQNRPARAVITEPEPGRRLVETDSEAGTVTTFDVEPAADGTGTKVTITTEMRTRPGIAGAIERWVSTRLLTHIYEEELGMLTSYVSTGGRE